MEHGSKSKDFIAYLGTLRKDVANVTAPPFFLAPLSVVELPSCWTQCPSIFISPTVESDPEERALRVLQWILCSLKSQFYIGQEIHVGMRQPLNAFLGELFFGQWTDETSTMGVISEQVSHHPPIIASYMWDDEHGIRVSLHVHRDNDVVISQLLRGIGYTRVEMTFTGSLNVKQTGHAMLHLDKYNEDYLIPLPICTVKGFLSACSGELETSQHKLILVL